MNPKRKPKRLSAVEVRPNTRRAVRRVSEAIVTLSNTRGQRSRVRLRDVSVFGCSLASAADWLRMGMFVSLRVDADWTIPAVVRWSRAGICGVEFLRPISDAEMHDIDCE